MAETKAVPFAPKVKMKRPDVETLIAYAKGAVTPEKARLIERFLESDDHARRVIEDFCKMQALVTASGERPQRRRSAPILKSPGFVAPYDKAQPARVAGLPKRATALAASVAIIIALGLGGFLLGRDEESPIAIGRLSTIDTLSATLTRIATGTPDLAGDRVITVLMTFRDAARRACRKFEIADTSPTTSRIGAVACLDSGAWRIEGGAWLGSEYAPASSGSADPLAVLLRKLGAGGALAPEDEAALIARNWQDETKQ